MGSERPKYWFPLAMLGFVQLVLAMLPGAGRQWFEYMPLRYSDYRVQPPWDVSDYWPFAMALVWIATVGWYTYLAKARYGRALLVTVGGILVIALVEFVSYSGFGLADTVRDPVLVTAGLLLAGWLDRSVLVLVVAVLFLAASLLSPAPTAELLIPAMIVFAGAFAVLLKRPRPTADMP